MGKMTGSTVTLDPGQKHTETVVLPAGHRLIAFHLEPALEGVEVLSFDVVAPSGRVTHILDLQGQSLSARNVNRLLDDAVWGSIDMGGSLETEKPSEASIRYRNVSGERREFSGLFALAKT